MSRKLTQEEFESKFNSTYQGRLIVKGQYKNARTPIEVECAKCHFCFSQTPNTLDRKQTHCPICYKNGNTHMVYVGKNDMWTTNPNIAKMLVNPEEGYKYRFSTDKKLELRCPQCGNTRFSLPRKFKNGFVCPLCSDGISYPNKLMAHLLKSVGLEFSTEYWIEKKYRYDFFFLYNGKKYIIEMDGGLGHGHVAREQDSIESQIKRDREKDEIAKRNGYVLIRIDCYYHDLDKRALYIKTNILKSELAKMFHFSDEMFDEADVKAHDSTCVKFANLWNSGVRSYDELRKILNVNSRTSIRSYAKQSIKLKLIDLTYDEFLKEVRLASNAKLSKTKGIHVLCEQTQTAYVSIAQAKREMKVSNLETVLSKNKKTCGKLPDGAKLTWRKLTNEEYEQYIKKELL